MALIKNWNGNAFGTNTGKLAVTLIGDDASLSGTLRFADADTGLWFMQSPARLMATR